jgi:N-acetylglucosamine kinase-like BadF-type ATPase
MILIADSGSTKVHWCLMAANGQSTDVMTDGINPFFQTSDAMRNSINNQLLPQIGHLLWAGKVTHVFFYGAGCTPEKIPFVQKAIQGVFRSAEVVVSSDMLGAARGLLGQQKGVACILGTGSGSCLYEAGQIKWAVPSLGYILGDEGSAAVMGKRLVGDLLKNQLGEDLKQEFLELNHLTMADIIEHVYRQPFPNRWLASLARFCSDHIEDQRIHDLVYDHLQQFVRRNVQQYYEVDGMENPETSQMPVGFVGSVAYYYRPVLQEVMDDYGFTLGKIMQDPIEGLKLYHRKDVVPTM